MYHKGYVEALPVQLPEVTELVREYFKTHYNHNYICRHKKKLVENFIEDFIPWLNSGHLKFKGLKDFKHVYVTNGITEAIHTTMIEHGLRPMTQKGEYPGYFAHAKVFRENGLVQKCK